MRLEVFKHGLCITFGGVADISAFGISNDQDIVRHGSNDPLQSCPAGFAILFEKREIRFVSNRNIRSGSDDGVAKIFHSQHARATGLRNPIGIGVQSYAKA